MDTGPNQSETKSGFKPEEESKRLSGQVDDMMNENMIPTMRVDYFDGSYYTVRKDRPGWEDILEAINKKKGQKFLCDLTREEQIDIIKNVDLVKVTEMEMTEADYMKIPASPDIAKIQIGLGRTQGAGFKATGFQKCNSKRHK